MAKWGYHLPHFRQTQMMAAKGVDIERSTLARSAGYAAALLDPIYNRIREIGRTRTKIHTDGTRLPILAPSTGTTHKGALWVYVSDDRNSGSQEPPIAWYRATMGRAGESVMSELAGFAGTLQADGFTGYVAAVHMLRRPEKGSFPRPEPQHKFQPCDGYRAFRKAIRDGSER
ncbi:transposase [Mesorhizobium sp.]|uniref:IS66 family transposase n=1 Tax=Mesorhizobium sp. TaxID=1871066 RepID=UPI0025C1AC96|nr:transposase [Mesorhizobium sp.]